MGLSFKSSALAKKKSASHMVQLLFAMCVILSACFMSVRASPMGEPVTEDLDCITIDDIVTAQSTWAGAVVAIGDAWRNDLASNFTDGCSAADVAQGALDAAYAYHLGVPVLFKPTFTQWPHTYRPTAEGAVSYFVGDCAGFDPDLTLTSPFDRGFALAYRAVPDTFDDFTDDKGYSSVFFDEMDFLTEETAPGLGFCHSPVAMGKGHFQSYLTGLWSTVDKTFAYIPNPDFDGTNLKALLVTHHSSEDVGDTPINEPTR